MSRSRRLTALAAAVCSLSFTAMTAWNSAQASAGSPVVMHTGVVTRQDIPSRSYSEPDTVVEPDEAVSPLDRNVAIAAAHDSRFPDGGAVDISVAWTHDGGATWHHNPVRGVTKAAGGVWDRASDPVVAFGPDGTAYLSILAFSAPPHCPTAVVVLRSRDGGMTWSQPFYVHRSSTCSYSDDKNWIVVDNGPQSPYRGRLYQFWTPFRYSGGNYVSSPQAVRWSDDRGTTWSGTHYVTPINHGSQNSQPMIMPNGTVVDTYYDYGVGGAVPGVVPGAAPERPQQTTSAVPSTIDASGTVYAATSTDGGRTWGSHVEVVNNAGGYATGVRCCLFGADIDAVTHIMYVAYEGGGPGNTDPVMLTSSRDGVTWFSPVPVSRGDVSGVQRVNVDVSARNGYVYVAYGTRTDPGDHGGFVQQQLSTSSNRGNTFDAPMSIGPVSALQYAAQSRGYFPGDYIGTAVTDGRLYLVWAVSSKPPAFSTSPYHQVIWGATLSI
jgi:hypothetical protein